MASVKQKTSTITKLLSRKAEEFHGHLGPFLVMGVRMGQIGIKALDAEERKNSLHIFLKVPLNVPYSCIVDGIQISTACTVGNQKLQLKEAGEIEAEFKDLSNNRSITITPHPNALRAIKGQMIGKNLSEEEICKLAWSVASMPEEDLFVVKNK